MTSLARRVKNLEASGGECPECGFDGDWSKVKPVWATTERPGRNHYCGTCGRPTHIVVTWGEGA